MNTMTPATAKFTAQEQPQQTRKLGGSWKYWFVLAAVALIAGLAFKMRGMTKMMYKCSRMMQSMNDRRGPSSPDRPQETPPAK
jgi:hypothetical protein